jgi:hypothetical protein
LESHVRGTWLRKYRAFKTCIPYLEATGLVEGEDHATTNDDLVSLLQQGLDDGDLGGHLGATDDGDEWLLGVLDGTCTVGIMWTSMTWETWRMDPDIS